jgi:F0F1-type ATP synthase assembly protein I
MNPQNRKAMAMAFAMGGELAAILVVGVLIGYYGGRYFQFAEWGAVIGSFLGFFAWVWRIVASKKYLQ